MIYFLITEYLSVQVQGCVVNCFMCHSVATQTFFVSILLLVGSELQAGRAHYLVSSHLSVELNKNVHNIKLDFWVELAVTSCCVLRSYSMTCWMFGYLIFVRPPTDIVNHDTNLHIINQLHRFSENIRSVAFEACKLVCFVKPTF